jgi:hypothetical protein
VPPRLPCLLNDPPAAEGRVWLANARLFDGTAARLRDRVAVLVEDGRIEAIAGAGEEPPESARVIDLGGRTLMPGLIDAHQHATASSRYFCKSANEAGSEAIWPGTAAHVVAQVMRELLRMGITTFRDVGGYDDLLVEARQAMRYGAFAGPRVLACGRIVSATRQSAVGPGNATTPIVVEWSATADANGVYVLPSFETPYYKLGEEGRKRIRFVYLSYDARTGASTLRDAHAQPWRSEFPGDDEEQVELVPLVAPEQQAVTGSVLQCNYILSPQAVNWTTAGGYPSTSAYTRFRLPVGKFPYGIAFQVKQLQPTTVTRVSDLAIEAHAAERSRV